MKKKNVSYVWNLIKKLFFIHVNTIIVVHIVVNHLNSAQYVEVT